MSQIKETFGYALHNEEPYIIETNNLIILKNAMLISPVSDVQYVICLKLADNSDEFVICSLSHNSPHQILDVPLTGKLSLHLKEDSNLDGHQELYSKIKVQVDLIGQIVSNERPLINNSKRKEVQVGDDALNGYSNKNIIKRSKAGDDIEREINDDDNDDDGADDDDDDDDDDGTADVAQSSTLTKSTKQQKKMRKKHILFQQQQEISNKVNDNSKDVINDDTISLGNVKPKTEEEYKQAIIMYLRQHGTTTLNKLGMAIKKPKCVQKSLRKYVATIKCTKAKRLGTSLEIVGENVHLIQKTNY